MHTTIAALSDTRRAMLVCIKQRGGATISELAGHLGMSDEGARQHLIHLERQGWIQRRATRPSEGRSGRPAAVYEVSASGENLFPKRYDELAIALVDIVRELYGPEAITAVLSKVTDAWVEAWKPLLEGKPLDEQLGLLKDYYGKDDPFITVERNGHVSLVEHNCPFINVAQARPPLCSITVNTLSRLLGHPVTRERKFQRGDGCCEFRIHTENTYDARAARFDFEPGDPDDPA